MSCVDVIVPMVVLVIAALFGAIGGYMRGKDRAYRLLQAAQREEFERCKADLAEHGRLYENPGKEW